MATTNFTVAGKCRCSNNPVQFEYSKEPYEVHYCLCTDCTDTCGGAMAIICGRGEECIQNSPGQ
jgi:hypothetical protein